jgi:uridine kinase
MSLRPEDVVIAVMGCGGSGKTTFINFFADERQQVNQYMDDGKCHTLRMIVLLI